MGLVIVNGKRYTTPEGSSVSIIDNNVYCNGKLIIDTEKIVEKNIKIEVQGNVNELKTSSGNVNIIGNCGNVKSTSGDITIKGDINGNVATTSGDIRCSKISGNVDTVSGDIIKRNYALF